MIFAFKCFLVNAGFLAAMHPFSSCSLRMCLVVSTDTKLDKSYNSSLILQSSLAEFLLSWSVSLTYCVAAFEGDHILVDSKHFQVSRQTSRGFLRNTMILSYCSLAYTLGHFHYFYPHFFGKFHHDFKCNNFHYI